MEINPGMNSLDLFKLALLRLIIFTTDRGFKLALLRLIVVLSFIQAPIRNINPELKDAKQRGIHHSISSGKPQFCLGSPAMVYDV